MKKLMIAALAVASIAGAYAACTPGKDPVIEDAWVYTWKFTGKTTTGVLVSYTINPSGNCKPGGGGVEMCAIRVPTSLNIQGYTYKCLPCCGGFTELADDGEVFWTTKPQKELFEVTNAKKLFTEGLTIDFGHVIGKKAKNVSEGEALNYVLGYTAANDVTERHMQKKDGQWTRAKSFDTFCPLGAVVETDATSDDLEIIGKRNGVVVQRGRTRDLINSVAKSISFISGVMTLLPGDVILTGTPEGIGELSVGDVFEVEIPGVATLKNKVVEEEK